MKKTSFFILLSTAAFSGLFYNQTSGLNLLLFNLLLVGLLLIDRPERLQQKTTIVFSLFALATSYVVFWIDSSWAYTMNVLTVLLLAVSAAYPHASLPAALLHGFYALCTAPIAHLLHRVFNHNAIENSERTLRFKRLFLATLPLAVVFVFIQLYRIGNPIFNIYISKINLDFISFEWLFFTFYGTWLMVAFFKPKLIGWINQADQSIPNNLPLISEDDHNDTYWSKLISISNEVYTGVLLLGVLNGVLLLVNALDIFFVLIHGELPKGVTISNYVHNGIHAVILSVIFASLILLFYFRGYLNFYAQNKWLKRLTYGWIAQNCVLLVLTLHRNLVYINSYSLTHKRIGVIIYLLLIFVGLLTIFVKIYQQKNNWYLIRANAWSLYAVMAIYSLVDWDSVITKFNLTNFETKKKMEIDQRYLVSLSHTNLTQLFEFYLVKRKKLLDQEKIESNPRFEYSFESSSSVRTRGYYYELEEMLWYKYNHLNEGYKNHEWPSTCYTKTKVLREVNSLIERHHLSHVPARIEAMTEINAVVADTAAEQPVRPQALEE